MGNSTIELSVVATVYNGETTVRDLVNAIRDAIAPMNCSYEVILVDDRSRDNSWSTILALAAQFPEVRGLRLSRNFGQQIAMSAGITHAKGNYIVIMDGDLQNPPEAIPVLYNRIKDKYDLVYTTSKRRNDWRDELTSSIFWYIIRKVLGVTIVPNQLMLKIMTRRLALQYASYGEVNRTVAGIMKDVGFAFDIMEVDNKRRTSGGSNYTFFRRVNLMVDIIISTSSAPLNLMIYLGGSVFVVTIGLIFYYIFQFYNSEVPAGYTSLMLSVFFFGSLIVMMLGFIGRYLSNIYTEVRRRPLFIEDEKVNL